jgi:hypothetical protein
LEAEVHAGGPSTAGRRVFLAALAGLDAGLRFSTGSSIPASKTAEAARNSQCRGLRMVLTFLNDRPLGLDLLNLFLE